MDVLFDLLPVLFVLFVVFRVLRQMTVRTRRPGGAESAPSSFAEVLRRLEQAAMEANQANARPAQTTPPPLSGLAAPDLTPALSRLEETEFHAIGRDTIEAQPVEAFEHDRHGFGAENPTSEESFEHLTAEGGMGWQDTLGYDPHHLSRPSDHMPSEDMPSHLMPSHDMPGAHLHDPRVADALSPRVPLGVRLRAPGASREALVFQEVLGPPRSRRRGR